MSIESILERIAVALERLSSGQKEPTVPVAPVSRTPEFIPGEPEVSGEAKAEPITNAGLRDLVQKLLQEAEKKNITNKLVTFIRDEVCGKLSPAKPKLMELPADVLPKAVELINGYAKKNGLTA